MKLKTSSKILKHKTEVLFYLMVFILPFLALVPIATVEAVSPADISVHTAYEMINNNTQYPNLLILDVREQSEFNESHLYDATNIPLGEINASLSTLEPYKNTEIIVYCRTDFRSGMASQNLANNHNFTKIYNMLGGINAWIAAGYPVWTSSNILPSIDYSFMPFILILFGTIAVLILYYKKPRYK